MNKMNRSFVISLKGVDYDIDVVEDGEDVEVLVERFLEHGEDDIPEDELLFVIEYLVKEGFVTCSEK